MQFVGFRFLWSKSFTTFGTCLIANLLPSKVISADPCLWLSFVLHLLLQAAVLWSLRLNSFFHLQTIYCRGRYCNWIGMRRSQKFDLHYSVLTYLVLTKFGILKLLVRSLWLRFARDFESDLCRSQSSWQELPPSSWNPSPDSNFTSTLV
jgi:hypothetical protein